MKQTTLAQVRTRVRARADIQNRADRHPDSELNQYINNSWRKLYGKLASAHLLKNTQTQAITASGAYQYTLPADFFAMYGVFEEIAGRYHRELTMHNPGEHPFGRPGPQGPAVSYGIHERDDDHYVELLPQPTSGVYVYTYVPEPATLTADSDNMNGALFYDEYVVIDATMQVLTKDKMPTDDLRTDLAIIDAQIDRAAAARDLLQSTHIRNVAGGSSGAYDAADYSPYRSMKGGRWPFGR